MTFTCWIGLKRLCSLSAIQASTASTIISYLLIFFALLRISILSGLRVNQSLFIGTASMIWGTMGGAVLYFLGADPYFGAGAGVAFSGAFYHNATQLHSTTIGLVGLAMVLEYYNERRSQWLYLAALLIGSSLHFKPSFFTIIPFSLLLLFLITKQYKRLEWYFCAAILAFFVVLWILPKFFFPLSPNPMQVDFEPFYKQLSLFPNHAWTVRIIGNFILMASAFGLFVLAAIWGMRYLRQEKVQFQTVSSAYIITAVSLFLLGLFEHLSFHEPPPRQGDGNFTWALYSTMPYSLPMIGLFYNALKSVKLKHIVTLALLLHLTSGAVYAVTYLQYGKIVPDGDNSGELSSLRKRLNHNARGFAFNHDTTTIEAYLGVPCFNRGEQCEDYPDHYSDLCESTASLESNLKKINPDFIVLNRNSIDADKFPNTLFSGYFLLNSSKYGREIWLRQDYAKNSCE